MSFSGDTNPGFEGDETSGDTSSPRGFESPDDNTTSALGEQALGDGAAPEPGERDDDALMMQPPTGPIKADGLHIGEIKSATPPIIITGGTFDTIHITSDGVQATPALGDNWQQSSWGWEMPAASANGEQRVPADAGEADPAGGPDELFGPTEERMAGFPDGVAFVHTGGTIGKVTVNGAEVSPASALEPHDDGAGEVEGANGQAAVNEVEQTDDVDDVPVTDGPSGPVIPPGDGLRTGGHEEDDEHPDDSGGEDGPEATDTAEVVRDNPDVWIPRVDIDTSIEDMMTRPSSVNPYPELATGGLEVGSQWDGNFNPHILVHYPQVGMFTRVEAPFTYPVQEVTERPPLISDTDENGGTKPDQWIPFEKFWEVETADIAENHILDTARQQGVAAEIYDRIRDNQSPEYSNTSAIQPEPSTYVRDSIAAMQADIDAGRPEAAFMTSQMLFRGYEIPQDGQPAISNRSTMDWSRAGLPRELFPEFASSWDNGTEKNYIDGAGHPNSVGYAASRYVTGLLSGQALDGAMGSEAGQQQSAGWQEKVGYLRERVAHNTSIAEADLFMEMRAAQERFPDATVNGWVMPENLSEYVLGRLAA